MKKINLAITGCMGRMGQQLIKSSKSNNNFRLVTLTENRIINKKFNGIKPEPNTEIAFEKTDIIIDFTIPKCTIEVLKIASKLNKRVVIGTTGFTKKNETNKNHFIIYYNSTIGGCFSIERLRFLHSLIVKYDKLIVRATVKKLNITNKTKE